MKGHGSSGSRGKQYGLMLFLALGTAILGVMVLHKLRESRTFNLLVKVKDRELISLQLLLQKERDYKKEAKRKIEEMKAKIYSLRTQKTELDIRILEMKATISSLKDEQRTMESALEEKQNEIKSLREKEMETNKENPQVLALRETLKQKEAEIEDLKHRLEDPTKVWSVSRDNPSNPAINLTKHEASVVLNESTRYDESLNKSSTYRDGDTSKRGDDRREERVGFTDISNATETIVNHGDGIAKIGEMENLNLQGGEGQQLRMNSRGGMKLEMAENSLVSADVRLLKPRNSEDAENARGNGGNTNIDQQTDKGQEGDDVPDENFEKSNRNPDDSRTNKTVDGEANETAGNVSKEHVNGVQQQIEIRDGDKVDQNSEEAEVANEV